MRELNTASILRGGFWLHLFLLLPYEGAAFCPRSISTTTSGSTNRSPIASHSSWVRPPLHTTSTSLAVLDPVNISLADASEESWRQYVPLAASAFVMIDIFLGSPFAKGVMSIVRSMETAQENMNYDDINTSEDDSGRGGKKNNLLQPPSTLSDYLASSSAIAPPPSKQKGVKERVDTRAVAQQALDKAAASLELRKFLDESKTDLDRAREMQSKLDDQLRAFDEKSAKKGGDGSSSDVFLIVPEEFALHLNHNHRRHHHHHHHHYRHGHRRGDLYALTASNTRGDPLRAATGIRPSLHPLTINALSTILQRRRAKNNDAPLDVNAPKVEALQVALAAGQVASEALQKRQDQSVEDDMQLTPDEGQTVAGRIVGVTMRLPELEALLVEKCLAAPWIAKYQEWSTFGVLEEECVGDRDAEAVTAAVDKRVQSDPLFALCRAECLLALFLSTVEQPELAAKNATVPDQSRIDFLDSDRREVLLEGE